MFPEHRSTLATSHAAPDHGATARRSPIVGGGTARVSRTADVVLARLIADEASFARRVHRSREAGAGHRPVPARSFLGRVDADPERLA